MAKGAYIGVSNVAKTIKKGYIGVSSVARKIKKAYIGVGGVAKLCWAAKNLEYSGVATSIQTGRHELEGASTSKYAIFAGGSTAYSSSYGASTAVDAYNISLTRTTPTNLSIARKFFQSSANSNHAIFPGGWTDSNSVYNGVNTKTVDCYDASLTRTSLSELTNYMIDGAGCTLGETILFACGRSSAANYYGNAYAYNQSLTKSNLTTLTARCTLGGASNGTYAIFAGGSGGSVYKIVDAFNTSMTKTSLTTLSNKRSRLAGASNGTYALFAGGYLESDDDTGTNSSLVEAYNNAGTRISVAKLPVAMKKPYGVSAGTTAIYIGSDTSETKNYVVAYDSSLTMSYDTTIYGAPETGWSYWGLEGSAGAYIGSNVLVTGGVYRYLDENDDWAYNFPKKVHVYSIS